MAQDNIVYAVFNVTDGIPFQPEPFETKEDAEAEIKVFKERLQQAQGYYFTSNRERIPVDEVEFSIEEIEFDRSCECPNCGHKGWSIEGEWYGDAYMNSSDMVRCDSCGYEEQ